MKVRDLVDHLNKLAPEEYAEPWDNVGLQVGDEEAEVENVLVALNVNDQVIDEALGRRANLIVSHHPLIFHPLSRIDQKKPVGRWITRLLSSGINLYVAHTNLDVVEGGVSAALAEALDLQDVKPLTYISLPSHVKLVTFVPWENVDQVREALCDLGAGRIGNYKSCSFQIAGEGTFQPLPGSSPHIGEVGRLERVQETRLEILVDKQLLQPVIDKLKEVHPYEEPAYDIYPVEERVAGLGRIGRLPRTLTLKELAETCRQRLGARGLRYLGDAGRKINMVSVCGGSGEDVIEAASQKSDALVTGDIKYHAAMKALDLGLHVIDAGHAATETVVLPRLASYLRERLEGSDVEVALSAAETNPWHTED